MKPEELFGKHVGQPVDRVDGVAKVTGRAKYAAEYPAEGLLYGVVVSAEITKGKIKSLDTSAALKVPGVVEVITHENRPSISWFNKKYADQDAPPGWHFRFLFDEEVHYAGQPIALVLAEGFEQARYAARLVRAEYTREDFSTNIKTEVGKAYAPPKKSNFEKPSARGHSQKAFEKSDFRVDVQYEHHMEHHNPMEMFASTVIVEGDKYTIYDKTQGTLNSQTYVCNVFGLKTENVRVKAPYVGGAFGSGLRPQYQLYLAMMGALKTKRSVRVSLTRQQMFSFGHRPPAIQKLKLGANARGVLQSLEHSVIQQTSRFEDYAENIVNWSGLLYRCDNVTLDHLLAAVDTYTPLDMRAPGAATGLIGLECAMDELAAAAGIDPVEFRLNNYAEKDQNYYGRPFSSKELKACYAQGAEAFGWSKRNPAPMSMREGKKLVGWGMATGIWEAIHNKAESCAEFSHDGKLKITSAITDIGTGTYTILAQIAAETLGLEIKDVKVELADTNLTAAPLQGGSWTASTLGAATYDACNNVAESIFKLASKRPDSVFAKKKFTDVEFSDGSMRLKGDASSALPLIKILKTAGEKSVQEKGKTAPNMLKALSHARNTHSAVFVEVKVDEDFRMIEVTRVVSAVAAGKILNPKTARSQILGGVVWGISQALHEESQTDHRLGRIMNHNLAEYHIPVNKDIGDIQVIFVEEEDTIASPIGIKGIGEIGICGTAAAVGNAIFHATGKRVRHFPITLDKLL